MVLYDALSLRKSVPRHRTLDRKARAVELGSLDRDGLSGRMALYDGQVGLAERLCARDTAVRGRRRDRTVLSRRDCVASRWPAGRPSAWRRTTG